MLSTMHSLPEVDSSAAEKKPEVILHYNSIKSGIDILDKKVWTYTSKRMTGRWPVALFHNMINVSAVNAYIVGIPMAETARWKYQDFWQEKKEKVFVGLGKDLVEYQVLHQRKTGTQFSPKVTEKELQWKTRHQKQAEDRKCRKKQRYKMSTSMHCLQQEHLSRTFASYLHSMHPLIGENYCNSLGLSICSFLNALSQLALVCGIAAKLCVFVSV